MRRVDEVSLDTGQVLAGSTFNQQERAKTPYRILIVEDDASLADVEAHYLTAHAYTVMIASTGELAITTFSHFIPDLVVLDIELPGLLNGWDVLQALRKDTHIPVIITTSLTLDVRTYAQAHGETRLTLDHLAKPFPMQALLKRIKRMLIAAHQ